MRPYDLPSESTALVPVTDADGNEKAPVPLVDLDDLPAPRPSEEAR